MTQQTPTVVLVHGAFAESASWNGVVEKLQAASVRTIAAANPLRSLPGDAAYVRDVLNSIDGPVVLVAHSYGGMVCTEAAAGSDKVVALVYACAFAPDHGESAFELSL
jgi:pimeloyl-ACP methyl ester carboxylesterase